MIDFACTCGLRFSVKDDMAGGLVQCPRCKKLNDVPLISDLPNLEDGGIYKITGEPGHSEPDRLAGLVHAFTRDHYDKDGNPIDLRLTLPQIMRAGADAIALERRDQVPPGAPKYDPQTGELIRPLDVKPDNRVDPRTIPLGRRARRRFVGGLEIPGPAEVVRIPLRLLHPINLVVMFFVLLAHVVGAVMMSAIASYYWVLAPFWALLHLLIISHFGNVIDETGPCNRNELPTPLRTVDLHEDMFSPLVQLVTAAAMCYGPAGLMLLSVDRLPLPIVQVVAAGLGAIGALLFPATVLTLTTSGSIVNARPDRVLLTALRSGPGYVVAVGTGLAAIVLWLAGTIGLNWLFAAAVEARYDTGHPLLRWYYVYPVLALGIYMMHFFCWHLGSIYRKHQARFPWLFQRHVGQPKAPPTGFAVSAATDKRTGPEPPRESRTKN